MPDVALISGIAWDHINVFPTFEIYVEQFKIFADKISENGSLIYFQDDENICKIANSARKDIKTFPYCEIEHKIVNNQTIVVSEGKEYPLQIFGKHNLINLNAAMKALEQIGVKKSDFLSAITSFKGASKRLEIIKNGKNQAFYSDFAHSPSKLKATVEAMKSQYAERKLTACMELHTFSSLMADFLPQYKGCMESADKALVYFNPKVLEHKKLPPISADEVRCAFGTDNVEVFTDSQLLQARLRGMEYKNTALSSGEISPIFILIQLLKKSRCFITQIIP